MPSRLVIYYLGIILLGCVAGVVANVLHLGMFGAIALGLLFGLAYVFCFAKWRHQ